MSSDIHGRGRPVARDLVAMSKGGTCDISDEDNVNGHLCMSGNVTGIGAVSRTDPRHVR